MACQKIQTSTGWFIVCGPRQPGKRCYYCNARRVALCDHPVFHRGKRVDCNTPLCEKHRTAIGPNADLCPNHAEVYALNGNRLVFGDLGEVRAGGPREPSSFVEQPKQRRLFR